MSSSFMKDTMWNHFEIKNRTDATDATDFLKSTIMEPHHAWNDSKEHFECVKTSYVCSIQISILYLIFSLKHMGEVEEAV